jgi:hypothetical protein
MSYPSDDYPGSKDAIHVCVQRAQAGHDGLHPGDLVHLLGDTAVASTIIIYDGVVDPFKDPAHTFKQGEALWVFMRPDVPRTLTHHWENKNDEPIDIFDDQDECRNCYKD